MKRFCLKVFSHILFALSLITFSITSHAGSKVGYVQMKEIMQSQQSMDVGKRLMTEFKPRNTELEKFRKQIQEKETALDKETTTMSQKDYAAGRACSPT